MANGLRSFWDLAEVIVRPSLSARCPAWDEHKDIPTFGFGKSGILGVFSLESSDRRPRTVSGKVRDRAKNG